jgi:outer membrane protein assembly factor BamD (BamD/ComL family)
VSTAASASSPDDQLAHERQIIDKARSALARRDPDAALAAVAEHARSFPKGQLVEMREALAVQALVQGGRGPEARARAERFHRSFPASMYSPVVDSAISSIP